MTGAVGDLVVRLLIQVQRRPHDGTGAASRQEQRIERALEQGTTFRVHHRLLVDRVGLADLVGRDALQEAFLLGHDGSNRDRGVDLPTKLLRVHQVLRGLPLGARSGRRSGTFF